MTILVDSGQCADGLIFYTQQHGSTGNGLVIMDTKGRPVWFRPLQSGVAADFRVQTYQGQPVLTWAQGLGFQNPTPGTGVDYICDTSYNVVATVRAGNGLNADPHEFELTPNGTALIAIYHQVSTDLSAVGGPKSGNVLEGAVQEIDVATGAVRFEWHSLDHVGFDESYLSPPASASTTYDYFHLNSVTLDTDGNLLVSARHTSTIYKIDHTTGAILWRLGGKKSDFTLGPGLPFGWQHNTVAVDAATVRVFDNEASPPSRILWVRHDDATSSARVTREIRHPAGLFAAAEGGAQSLPNGNTFVGWGTGAAMSEFDQLGNLIYDVRFANGYSTYRAVRLPWAGHPATDPTLAAYQHDDGTITVHAIWNGATDVANWQVLGTTPGGGPARQIALVPWDGLDTASELASPVDTLQVLALDQSGTIIGTSTTVSAPFAGAAPSIDNQPDSSTVGAGSSVVLTIGASDVTTYQWFFNGRALGDNSSGEVEISGANTATLMLRGVSSANAGRYTCTVSNPMGTVTSAAAQVRVSATSDIGRLVNVSCRSVVSGGDNALIVGFVVAGNPETSGEPLSIRVSGPALTAFGVPDVLPDPKLTLFNLSSRGNPVVLAARSPTRIPHALTSADDSPGPGGPTWADADLRERLSPSAYTAMVTSDSGASGVALAEVEDTSVGVPYISSMPRLINGSGRAAVGTGADVLIAGFVISGSTSRTVLIRASGPALSSYGVHNALRDPKLDLYTASGEEVATNSGWIGSRQIAGVAVAVGAFSWPNAPTDDAALLVTLPPGAYTALVSSASGNTGVALVEVYDAQ